MRVGFFVLILAFTSSGGANAIYASHQGPLARAYYGCKAWQSDPRYGVLNYKLISEEGQTASGSVTLSTDACQSQVAVLRTYRASIERYTEIAICRTEFMGQPSGIYLDTVVLTPTPSADDAISELFQNLSDCHLPNLDECIIEASIRCAVRANELNGTPGNR